MQQVLADQRFVYSVVVQLNNSMKPRDSSARKEGNSLSRFGPSIAVVLGSSSCALVRSLPHKLLNTPPTDRDYPTTPTYFLHIENSAALRSNWRSNGFQLGSFGLILFSKVTPHI
jgi:hypothetical protein